MAILPVIRSKRFPHWREPHHIREFTGWTHASALAYGIHFTPIADQINLKKNLSRSLYLPFFYPSFFPSLYFSFIFLFFSVSVFPSSCLAISPVLLNYLLVVPARSLNSRTDFTRSCFEHHSHLKHVSIVQTHPPPRL